MSEPGSGSGEASLPTARHVKSVELDLFDFSRFGGQKFSDRTKLSFLDGHSVRDVMLGIFEHQALFLAKAPAADWRPASPWLPTASHANHLIGMTALG